MKYGPGFLVILLLIGCSTDLQNHQPIPSKDDRTQKINQMDYVHLQKNGQAKTNKSQFRCQYFVYHDGPPFFLISTH